MAKNPYTGPYAQETLQFTTTGARHAEVTLNLTYEADQTKTQKENGYVQVVAATGTYEVLNKQGGVIKTRPITELLAKDHVGNNDDELYLPGKHKHTVVDNRGLSFAVGVPQGGAPAATARYNFFYSKKFGGYELYFPYEDTDVVRKSVKLTPSTGTTASESVVSDAVAATCFASGTRIRTAAGERTVEALAVGDLVVTASGALRPIRWLGHRTIDCRRHPRPALVQPVRIAAHAFGDSLPARDLVVSPGHAIRVEAMGEALVPAGALVNGTTITQVPAEHVTYWHVELESHDIVLAENLACESYLDMGNRDFFVETGTVALAAVPDMAVSDVTVSSAAARTHADFCRPFHDAGVLVDAVRARLAVRAAEMAARPAADLRVA